MQTMIVAIAGKLFEVLLKVLLIPQIKEWAEKKRKDQEIKDLVKKNKEKEEAYKNATDIGSASDSFGGLP